MGEHIRIEIEIDSADHAALRTIADERAISVGDVAADALRARIDLESDWDEAVREGLADIEAGRTISHDEYLARAAQRRRGWLAARAG